MRTEKKPDILRARVTDTMRRDVDALAAALKLNESDVVRMAVALLLWGDAAPPADSLGNAATDFKTNRVAQLTPQRRGGMYFCIDEDTRG